MQLGFWNDSDMNAVTILFSTREIIETENRKAVKVCKIVDEFFENFITLYFDS